jgi:ferric-dicitrate binding protein FerR (iron transport regulator)
MNRLIRFAVAAMLLGSSAGPAFADDEPAQQEAPSPNWTARLTSVVGDVKARLPGDADFSKAEKGMNLPAGSVVTTGPDSSAEVALDGDSVIQLLHDSTFEVKSLERKESSLTLTFGMLLAKLRHLTEHENFRIGAVTSVAAIRGTEFAVSSEEGGSRIGVFDEGLVSVTTPEGGSEVQLSPNQESQIHRGATPTSPAALEFFNAYRGQMKKLRKRLDAIRKDWRRKNDDQRRKLRDRLDRYRHVR